MFSCLFHCSVQYRLLQGTSARALAGRVCRRSSPMELTDGHAMLQPPAPVLTCRTGPFTPTRRPAVGMHVSLSHTGTNVHGSYSWGSDSLTLTLHSTVVSIQPHTGYPCIQSDDPCMSFPASLPPWRHTPFSEHRSTDERADGVTDKIPRRRTSRWGVYWDQNW